MLLTCKMKEVKKPDNSTLYLLKKSAILLVDGKTHDVNMTELKEFFIQKHRITNLNYTEFDDRGYCMCSEESLVFYINDCKDEEKVEKKISKLTVISVVTILLTPAIFITAFIGMKKWNQRLADENIVEENQTDEGHFDLKMSSVEYSRNRLQ